MQFIAVVLVIAINLRITNGVNERDDLQKDGCNERRTIALESTPVLEHQRQKRFTDYDEITPCESDVTVDSLMRVRYQGTWYLVLSTPNNTEFTPRIRLETCINPGEPCPGEVGTLLGIRSTCEQKFTNMTLTILNGQNEPETIDFPLPTFCACTLQKLPTFNCVVNVSQSCVEELDVAQPTRTFNVPTVRPAISHGVKVCEILSKSILTTCLTIYLIVHRS